MALASPRRTFAGGEVGTWEAFKMTVTVAYRDLALIGAS
jgi:hypothetical protein